MELILTQKNHLDIRQRNRPQQLQQNRITGTLGPLSLKSEK